MSFFKICIVYQNIAITNTPITMITTPRTLENERFSLKRYMPPITDNIIPLLLIGITYATLPRETAVNCAISMTAAIRPVNNIFAALVRKRTNRNLVVIRDGLTDKIVHSALLNELIVCHVLSCDSVVIDQAL